MRERESNKQRKEGKREIKGIGDLRERNTKDETEGRIECLTLQQWELAKFGILIFKLETNFPSEIPFLCHYTRTHKEGFLKP